MKISTLLPARNSENAEMPDTFRKTILAILFICLAITALADSVHLFNEVSSTKVISHGYVIR